ncbi:MAG: gamma-glutamylcyclotransferase family protein [Gemmatimonadota bacterium]|nr:gamma-glutamylcyclotransferase family protein [Gemmatimonadota bacterium]
MLYFAYGSNMDWAQMNQRCPSACFVAVAKLPDHRIAFTRKSRSRGCGVADAVPTAGSEVWGVVFEIDGLDLGALDQNEGYRPGRDTNSYWRRECMVFAEGSADKPLTVQTYFATPEPNAPLPNQAYKDLIVGGARHWRLSESYIATLERIEVQR